MKKTLALDCDGVLSNFVERYLHFYNQLSEYQWSMEDFEDFDMFKEIGASWKTVDSIIHQKNFVYEMEFMSPETPHIVSELKKKYDLYILTSPWQSSPLWMNERCLWLKDRLGIETSKVIQTASKHLIAVDVFVDDKPGNLETSIAKTRIVYDAPYNKGEGFFDKRIQCLSELL